MKIIKTIGIILLICYAQNCFSQIDIMTEEDDEELEELSKKGFGRMDYAEFMKSSVYILMKPEAGVLGNWMGDKIHMMHDLRFAESPKEYKAAFTVKTTTLKIEAYNEMLKQLDLSCSKKKELLESYVMFLGTIYLDTFGMNYFSEKTEYTYNEFINISLGRIDAITFFNTGDFKRELEEIQFLQNGCDNDLNDDYVTNCNSKRDETTNHNPKDFRLGLELLHPLNIASLLTNLQSSLNSLPCKD